MDSFLIFAKADPLTKIIMEMVSHSFGSVELQQFREEFQAIDKSNTGSVSMTDFLTAFYPLQSNFSLQVDLKSIFQSICVERSCGRGKDMTYHEYIAAAMHNRVTVNRDRIELVFSYLDMEKKGFLSATAIRNFLGEDLSPVELENMISTITNNKSKIVTKTDIENQWKRVWSGTFDSDVHIFDSTKNGRDRFSK